MEKALLTIRTGQEGTDEKLDFTTRAEVERAGEEIKLHYREELTENESVETTLSIGEESVLVERRGATGADLFFKRDTTYEAGYKTVVGTLDMRVFTTKLEIDRKEQGVDASIAYHLFFQGVNAGSMNMDIRVEYEP